MRKVYEPPNSLQLKGRYIVQLYGANGILKQEIIGKNVVTDGGKEYLAAFLNSAAQGASTFPMRYIAIGTDSTGEAASNTGMGAELGRHTGTVSYVSNQIFQIKATFPANYCTGGVTEYGAFNTNTGGTLVSRDTESVVNKSASDTLTVTYQLTIS